MHIPFSWVRKVLFFFLSLGEKELIWQVSAIKVVKRWCLFHQGNFNVRHDFDEMLKILKNTEVQRQNIWLFIINSVFFFVLCVSLYLSCCLFSFLILSSTCSFFYFNASLFDCLCVDLFVSLCLTLPHS